MRVLRHIVKILGWNDNSVIVEISKAARPLKVGTPKQGKIPGPVFSSAAVGGASCDFGGNGEEPGPSGPCFA